MPEASPRRIGLLLSGLLLCVVVVMLSVIVALGPSTKGPAKAKATLSVADSDGPRLQSAPQADLGSYRARKAAELAAIGPLDGEPGWARIPLERAMDLMSEQGLRADGTQEDAP